ncbi:MAG: FtsX-like permease family protein [Saprospiraceae bacterium]|nr:FtsX-like permease family protein [Saprospiraceae bacterium]
MLFQLAWKNTWRNKVRSLLVLGSVMIGLWVGAFIMAYAFGAIDQRLEDAVSSEVSHFQVHHPEFKKDNEAIYHVPQGAVLLQDLREDARVESVTARIVTFGVVASAITSTGAKFLGVLPDSEDKVTSLKSKLEQGAYFDVDDKNKVIIGQKLADKLGVKLRSKIVLSFQDLDRNIASGAFRIIGLYKTYNSTYDELNVFVKYGDLADLLEMEEGYHEIAAMANDPDSIDSITEELSILYTGALIEDWKEISPELGLMVESLDQYMVIFLIIILLALSFGIINTMLMAVLERTREIGMLMAIGMNKWRVFAMIGLETVYLVVTASPLGLLLAYFSISYLGTKGIDLSSFYDESYAAIGFQTTIYPKLDTISYWQILLLVVITAVLASLYPAWTAIRLDPVKAIRKI